MSELKPIEQKEVPFQDRMVTAVMVQDEDGRENVYVPMRPLVEGIGLTWSSQYMRINRNPSLSKVTRSVLIMRTDIPEGSSTPKTSQMLCLPLSHLNGYLFGIDANRVKSELKELVIEYQDKCYEVLFHAFNGTESMRRFYTSVGFDEKWISRRMEKHRTSTDLGDVWLLHGIPIEEHDRLNDLINREAFGLTVAEHRQLKQIPENADLRDNMTTTELLISAFGDEATTKFINQEEPQGVDDHAILAQEGGKVAGEMRELFENRTNSKILSDKNNLDKKKRPLLDDEKDD